MKRIIKFLINYLKSIKLKKDEIFINPNTSTSRSTFGKYIKIYKRTEFNDSFIDSFSYVQTNCILNNVEIGKFTSIGPYTEIIYGKHPLDWISTHPIFYSTRKQSGISFTNVQLFDEFNYVRGTNRSCIIGNDVWIGYGVKIIEGVKINNGAIILAGAVVTKDIESYSIVGGVPAKHIKYRFKEDEIKKLNEIMWWNNDITWFKNNYKIFSDKKTFFQNILKDK